MSDDHNSPIRPSRPTTRTVRSRFASISSGPPASTSTSPSSASAAVNPVVIGNTNGVRGAADDGSVASNSAGTSSTTTASTTSTTVTLTLMPKQKPQQPQPHRRSPTTSSSPSKSASSLTSSKKSRQSDAGAIGHLHHHHHQLHQNLRERWLLTRKTWRYMADAGRKLIPDGASAALGRHRSKGDSSGAGNKASGTPGTGAGGSGRMIDDLTRLEEHFQQLCRAEPKFLPWRRKASYPGALTSMRRRKRGGRGGGASGGSSGASSMSPTSPPKASSADEADEEGARAGDDGQRLMLMIRMLEKYLNIQADDGDPEGQQQQRSDEGGEYTELMATGGTMDPMLTGSLYYEHSDEGEQTSPSAGDRRSENRTPLILRETNEQLKQNWLAQPYDGGRPQATGGGVHTAFRPSATSSSATSSKGGSSLTSPTLPTIVAGQTQAFFQAENYSNSKNDSTNNYNNNNSAATSTSGVVDDARKSSDWATSMHTSLLLDNLRHYSRSNRNPLLSYDRITSDVLTDKRLLRQIRDELKQQQLQRILRRHSSRLSTASSSALNLFPTSSSSSNLAQQQLRQHSRSTTTASSSSSSSIFSFWQRDPRDPTTASSIHLRHVSEDRPDSGGDRGSYPDRRSAQSGTRVHFQRRYVSAGTQTDPIPITHLQQLHIDYRKRVDAEAAEAAAAAAAAAAEAEAAAAAPATPPPGGSGPGAKHSRRKSSIDNEDVSQSVSDTIKRYLRMARKKSVHESDADRFKRVNYDQTLRNIKPKGDYSAKAPGDDDGTAKGAQTDGDWIVRVMSEIRALGRQLGVLPGGTADDGDEDALPRATNIHSIMGMRPAAATAAAAANAPPTKNESTATSSNERRRQSNLRSSPRLQQASSPPSGERGGGLFHSSTQFLSSLLPWHSEKHLPSSSAPQSPTSQQQQQQPQSSHTHTNPASSSQPSSPPPSTTMHQPHHHHSSQSLFFSSYSSSPPPPPPTSSTSSLPSSPPPPDVASSRTGVATTMQPPSLAQQLLQATATATATTASSAQQQQQQNAAAAAAAAAAALLTKSKSSSNVSQTFAKKIWKSRSKSQSRTASPSSDAAGRLMAGDGGAGFEGADGERVKSEWLPQGNGVWTSVRGDRLQLHEKRLFELGEPERLALHRVAVDRIGQLNIGVNVTPPDGNPAVAPAPKKRRPLLLKRKALTTGFFDTAKSKEDSKAASSSGGLVFGIGLQKVVDNDLMLRYRRGSAHGSTSSLCGDGMAANMAGSCESLSATHHGVRGGAHQRMAPGDASDVDLQVPQLVRACCAHLLEHGMSTVGIFRVGTIKRRVEQLKEDFDRGDCTHFDSDAGPHDVAYLLKDFLRSMPEPLLCRSLYAAFLQTQKIRNRRLQLEAMSHLIQLLPVAHRDTLFTLLRFLAEVARHAEDSIRVCRETGARQPVAGHRMDASNLATVMSPNILHDTQPGQAPSESEVSDRLDVINVVRTMIDHCDELFIVPVDILDDVYAQLMDASPRQLDELCDAHLMAEGTANQAGSGLVGGGQPATMTSAGMRSGGALGGAQVGMSVFSPQPDAMARAPDFAAVPEPAPRRVYVRQEFMHQNTVRGSEKNGGHGGGTGTTSSAGVASSSGSPIGATTIKRRERTSKMRYQEPENEMAGPRRRRAVSTATVLSSSSSRSAASGATLSSATPDAGFPSGSKPHHSSTTTTTTSATLKSQSSSTIHSSSSGGAPAPDGLSPPRSSSIDSTGNVPTPTPSPKLSSMMEQRRLSSPFVQQHDGSGVMSASFQIPVQLQSASGVSASSYHLNQSTLNLGADDLAQIPYIEDGSGSSGNSGVNVGGATYGPGTTTTAAESATPSVPVARTGSLKRGSMLLGSAASAVAAAAAQRIRGVTGVGSSTSSSSSAAAAASPSSASSSPTPTPTSVQQRRTIDPPNSITIASLSLGQHHPMDAASTASMSAPTTPARATPPEKTRVEKSSSGSSLLKAAVGLSKKSFGLSSSSSSSSAAAATASASVAAAAAIAPARVESMEPKVSASISTIGSEVLRSKTADFERLLRGHGNGNGSGNNGGGGSSSAAAVPSRGRTGSSNGSDGSATRLGPIYKRQELISSRQSSKK